MEIIMGEQFDLHQRRKALGLTLEEIGRYVGVSKSTVKKWEDGHIKNMKRDKIALLAQILEISPLSIMGIEHENTLDSFDNVFPLPKMHKVPLIGEIACGEPILCDREYNYIDTDINADLCLRAKGDSMINARIYDGDIVFIRSQEDVENGEIAAVIIDDEATLKRVYYDKSSNKLILSPENPKYPPLVYLNEELNSIRILGKAVAFQSYIK